MESFVELALMTKAMGVFESEDTFLSFPLAPFAYAPESLDFMRREPATAEDWLMLSEFSRIVNRIPRGVLFESGEEVYLWEVYNEVMNTADLAKGLRTTAEEAEYQKALSFLYTATPEGLRVDSPALTVYRQYRDSHIRALEEYKNSKSTADSAADPKIKEQWATVDEPLLRQKIQAIEAEWRVEGRKDEVEAALRAEDTLGKKSPEATWEGWRTSFNPDIDLKTDTNNQPFALSGYSPYNVVGSSEWPKFTLSGPEVQALVQAAPATLKNRLAPNPIRLDIEALSFEYQSVAVTRPWFKSAVLKARFWRFPGSSQVLCDGGRPPQGRCTSYIAALVLARNVSLKLADTPVNRATLDHLAHLDQVKLANFVFSLPDLNKALKSRASLQPRRLAKVMPRSGVRVLAHPAAASALPKPATASAVKVATVADKRRLPEAMVMARLQTQAFPAIRILSPAVVFGPLRTPPGGGATGGPKPTEVKPEIYLMAFVCKRIPKCPDPDPGLQW